jgi:hypothetical protein
VRNKDFSVSFRFYFFAPEEQRGGVGEEIREKFIAAIAGEKSQHYCNESKNERIFSLSSIHQSIRIRSRQGSRVIHNQSVDVLKKHLK